MNDIDNTLFEKKIYINSDFLDLPTHVDITENTLECVFQVVANLKEHCCEVKTVYFDSVAS